MYVKGSPSKRSELKTDVIGPKKQTVFRRVRASVSPEILQAGAVKGLKKERKKKKKRGRKKEEN